MWIKGNAYYLGEVSNLCINFDRDIKDIRKSCKPDIEFKQDELIVPASIDIHVHVRGAQLSYKETVATATSEAVYGGVGTIFDMPNTLPPVNTKQRVIERLREFDLYSRTDFGIYSGVTNEFTEIDQLPIAGYKIFPEDLEKEETKAILENSKKLKILHPEIPLALTVDRRLRTKWMEMASLYLVKGRVHITHITSLDNLRLAKSLGFSTDITPHHMLVEGERDCLSKVNPPIRDYKTRLELLLIGLHETDALASDHAPHTKKEKSMHYELCPPGIAAVSFTTPFLYSLVFKGLLDINKAVKLLAENPAKIVGIKSGFIKEGFPANFTVIKREPWRYSTKFSKVTETPLDLYPLEAKITHVIVEGKLAYDGKDVYPIKGVNIIGKGS
ncbi:dihydroorotase [Stygiolobus caldivivus]|uniref:Dihydroorotase n=1 Tax=Stygiolobus caldivivus TaxID=2824673 RepID=A0A8D5U9K0_9CREN|nr:dihydroorotase [Stygiolobus caldivivus]BCU71378.1 dihydroorotase [Stygiolobus caldivivus]